MTTYNAISLSQELDFSKPLPTKILNIEDKSRSNLLTWRGQFSPQLVESLLEAYCPKGAVVLDPFSGSGTVIFEAAQFGASAYGVELNPAAWILSRIYQLANYDYQRRGKILSEVHKTLLSQYPEPVLLYDDNGIIEHDTFRESIKYITRVLSPDERVVFDAFIIILDIANNQLTLKYIHDTFYKISLLIHRLPFLHQPIRTFLSDARTLPILSDSIDFILTSPPYINVFNYHQNYRRSAEMLDWDVLQVAKSEIGSNRANRGNRFLTVAQYCLDMAMVAREISRVCTKGARIIFVVGYESNVLGIPFYNADILQQIACDAGLFDLIQRQQRWFKNKFGTIIREDLLHITLSKKQDVHEEAMVMLARKVARDALRAGIPRVAKKNTLLLEAAIDQVNSVQN